ncbi:MAG: hypothetical protein WD010_10250, partial [Nitriliruptor sp.]
MLDALAETFAPPAEPPTVAADDPNGFWARSASEVGVGPRLAERLLEMLPPEDVDELGTLLDLLRRTGFTKLPQGGRERVLKALSAANPDARAGINGLRGLAMQLYYGAVDASGRNPNWDQLGYPGPPAIDPAPRELKGFVL